MALVFQATTAFRVDGAEGESVNLQFEWSNKRFPLPQSSFLLHVSRTYLIN